MEFFQDKLVDAIEEGRIVKVTEEHARREGLPILRKIPEISQQTKATYLKEKPKPEPKVDILDSLKKTPSWREKQVTSELISNWQWHIRMERRKKGLSRGQLAELVHEQEDNIKLLEFGTLPSEDFVLINKVQQALKINLRKDKKDFSQDVQHIMPKPQDKQKSPANSGQKTQSITGSDIEILEDEI